MSSIIYDDAPLEERIHRSLSDTFKHRAIETAQDVITGKRNALVAEVENWAEFRDHAIMFSRTLIITSKNLPQTHKKMVHRSTSLPPTPMPLIAFWIYLKTLVLHHA